MGGKEMEVDSLEGVGPTTKQKLTDVGINTILDLAIRGPSDVADGIGFDMARAIELCNKARLKLVELGMMERDFVPASEILEPRNRIRRSVHLHRRQTAAE